jgi:hypothetical protein
MPSSRNAPKRRHRLRQALWWILAPAILFPTALALWGPPRFLLDLAFARLADRGIFVEADSLVYRPTRGWIAKDLRIFAPVDRVSPLCHFPSVAFRMHWWKGLRKGLWTGEIDAADGRLDAELGMWAEDLVTRQSLVLTRINARLSLQEEHLVVESVQARLGGIDVAVSGIAALADFRSEPGDGDGSGLALAARWAAQTVRRLEEFSFEPAAYCEASFFVDSNAVDPLSVELSLSFDGDGRLRGVPIRQARLRARYDGKTAKVDEVRVTMPDGKTLLATGHMAWPERVAYLHATNSLPRYTLEHLLPMSLTDLLQSMELRSEGQAHFTLALGPSPLENFGRRIEGRLDMTDVYYKEAFFPEAKLDLSYQNGLLVLTNVVGIAGRGEDRGPLAGSVLYDDNQGRLRVDLAGSFDPLVAVSLVPPGTEKAIREWDFPGQVPEVGLELEREDRLQPVRINARVRGQDLVLRGTSLDHVSARILSDGRFLSLTNLVATRGPERLDAWLRMELEGDLMWMDIRSSLDPSALARLAGRQTVDNLGIFRFKGTNLVEVSGQFDRSMLRRNQLTASARFEDVVWRWMQLDDLVLAGDLSGQTLVLPILHGRAAEGLVVGTVTATRFLEPDQSTFALNLKAQQIDLFKVITAASDSTNTPYSGKLSMDLTLWGNLADRAQLTRNDSLIGQGRLEVKEGTLFRIPLLFGLSRILSRVIRGFGYAEQTDFSSAFRVGGGRVQSDNLFLRGRFLSISGEGYIGFDRRLRANMKIQLLNEGLLSDTLKVLLWPIRKLIEIQVTGTLDEPDWQPRNLPKELFGK